MDAKGSEEAQSFYEEALVRASLEGESGEVGDDLGDLRRRLREVLVRRPDDVRLLLRGTAVLARMAASEHGMSARARGELAENVKAVLDGLGEQLL
jgi:hypothetical protein